MRGRKWMCRFAILTLVLVVLGCATKNSVLPEASNTVEAPPHIPGLSTSEAAALASLVKINDYPFYTMHSTADYLASGREVPTIAAHAKVMDSWACSLFAAFGDRENPLYGRNFDWEHSPALLLFTNPPGGYASVSMVDLAYLVPEDKTHHLAELPLEQRTELLMAPYWPFDGMNEYGLVVGMAAVPDSQVPEQSGHEWIGSLGIIRDMLDNARDVNEAVQLATSYNISFEGGPHIHYLVADADGRAVLIELFQGEFHLHPNSDPWYVATNFTLSAISGDPAGRCWRYDTLVRQLGEANGVITENTALDLLSDVAQQNTQWSIVYGLSTQTINVALGRDYQNPHVFTLME